MSESIESTLAEVKYNLEIKIEKDVDDKIRWFTSNYKQEISAFLTGELKDGVIVIDGLLYPHQDVSSGSVEVEPKNLIKMRKEYGDECLRIIGHWHSHHTMGAFWSATDDTFIEDYSRTKPLSIFFVSSTLSKHRCKVVINKPFAVELDNLSYSIKWDKEAFEEDLKAIIEEKVSSRVVTYTPPINPIKNNNAWEDPNIDYWNRQNHTGQEIYSSKQLEDEPYDSKEKEEYIKLKLKQSLRFDAKSKQIVIQSLSQCEAEDISKRIEIKSKTVKRGGDFEVEFSMKNKENGIDLIKEIKLQLEELFEESWYLDEYQRGGMY